MAIRNNNMIDHNETVLTKTVAMPADTNPNGDIFGGWLLSQMDVAGGILAKKIAKGRVATVAIEGMKFLLPVKVGDTVTCYGKLEKVGKTSISILLRVTTESWKNNNLKEVTNGKFIYVAIDSAGKPRQLPEKNA